MILYDSAVKKRRLISLDQFFCPTSEIEADRPGCPLCSNQMLQAAPKKHPVNPSFFIPPSYFDIFSSVIVECSANHRNQAQNQDHLTWRLSRELPWRPRA